MRNPIVVTTGQLYARLAGITILLYIVVGFTSVILYSRATNAEGTEAILAQIAAHISGMRMTVILELLESFCAVVLGVALYAITRTVNQELALLGMVCRVSEGVLGVLGIRNTIGLLWLSQAGKGPEGPIQATAGALGDFLLMPGQGGMIGSPFFAAGIMIFSFLLLRGRIVPAPLAGFGLFSSVLIVVMLPLQLAGFIGGPLTWYAWIPMLVFQILLGLWLLVKGARLPSQTQEP